MLRHLLECQLDRLVFSVGERRRGLEGEKRKGEGKERRERRKRWKGKRWRKSRPKKLEVKAGRAEAKEEKSGTKRGKREQKALKWKEFRVEGKKNGRKRRVQSRKSRQGEKRSSPLLQDLHELDDGGVSSVQLVFPLQKFLFLIGKVDELIQRLLVDVRVFLQIVVTFLQFAEQLLQTRVLGAENGGRGGGKRYRYDYEGRKRGKGRRVKDTFNIFLRI